jgi:hypothetical protein
VSKAGAEQLAQRLLRPAELPGAIDVRMAFYGDVFESSNVQGGAADPALLSPAETSGVEGLAAALLARAALAAGSARDRTLAADELARLGGTFGEEQGVGDAARSALTALARLRWFAPFGFGAAQRFVDRSLVQVTRYLTEPGIRASVQARVADLLGEDTLVLVGHSLGSVVAFEAACCLQRPLPLLVTLGSPLGIPTVIYQRLQPQPPQFPREVQWWVNVSAADDIVAAVPDLTTLFEASRPAGARFEGGVPVSNGSAPHDARHYLTKRAVGGPVADVLTAALEVTRP